MMEHREAIRRERLHREAIGYLELKMYEQVLATLERLSFRDRRAPLSLYLEGESLRSLDRHSEALVPLLQVAALQPEDVEVRLAIGWCQKRRGRLDLAILALEEASRIDPVHALVQYNLACYYSLRGDRDRSFDHLANALVRDPGLDELIDEEPDFDAVRTDPAFVNVRGKGRVADD